MLYLAHKPPPPLSDFVDVLWLYQGYEVSHEKERLMPDGSVELVINLAEDCIRNYDSRNPEKFETVPGCVVSGPRSEFFVIDTAGEAAVVGVHFKPGGAFPFFGLPAGDLHNRSVTLDDLWGVRGTARFVARLHEAPPFREQVAQQAERMLTDARTKAKLREFFLQWLKVDQMAEIAKDPTRYPEFNPALVGDLRTSLELFLDEVIWSNESDFRQLLQADWLSLCRRATGR